MNGKKLYFQVTVNWSNINVTYDVSLGCAGGGIVASSMEKFRRLMIFICQYLFLLVELKVKTCLETTVLIIN